MYQCSSCGAVGIDSDRFCSNCGRALVPIEPRNPPYIPVTAPSTDQTALIIVVVVLVVMSVVAAVILYGINTGLHSQLPVPTFGVAVGRSSDGTEWILSFTSVPPGLPQNATTFSLIALNGTWAFTPASLSTLEGGGLDGVRYVPDVTGPSYTACAPGDRILVASGSGTNQYPAGTEAHIISAGKVLFFGTLQ